jgi:hypothetical protein
MDHGPKAHQPTSVVPQRGKTPDDFQMHESSILNATPNLPANKRLPALLP